MTLNLVAVRALLSLYAQNGFSSSVRISTPALAKTLGTSQQSASRILIRLEKEGLIERRSVGRVTYVRVTELGLNRLVELYTDLRAVIERPMDFVLEGRVFTGFGEGAFYVSLPQYRQQLREKLGFDPFPGTLNVRLLSIDSINNRRLLNKISDIYIVGFNNGSRTYGGLKAIHGTFNEGELCAILFIERTHYSEDVVEVVSPVYLRGRFGLKDGDKVRIRVTIPKEKVEREEVGDELVSVRP
ncbi:MAG: DUF120 domain-containing protein [Thaumarchaeota archaeon]|nr:DUF120 domain-containing protein [Candidatus Calditenuaceae archaeon]MDW8041235.1 DUF120 domain-containing protein [Nitrososphaerota archaeon]